MDQNFDNDTAPDEQGADQSFGHGNPGWDLNNVTVDHPFDVYMFQYISTRTMKMRTNPPYKRVRLDPVITELQLPPPPPGEADPLPVGEQCMGLVLSSDCDAVAQRFAPIPVWEEQTPYATCGRSQQLPQWDDAEHPEFTLNEEVMLCPTIFLAMCQTFNVKPKIDVFASARHHQLPRYYSVDRNDSRAEGYNAFNFLWSPDTPLYINPPWTLLDEVMDKIIHDSSQCLLVTPRWPEKDWYRKLRKLDCDRRYWRQPLYLGEHGRMQRAPRWDTVFTFIPGRRR